ncbi:MAG TPA: DedA family protein [Rubricoccaceae bacterium]|nr:DedA family protein [Rubricoccaceae bacterium]
MELVRDLFDFILHIDTHLDAIVRSAGGWTYGIVALIVFCETGLVVTPLLPGDSLLFAAGAIAARPEAGLNVHLLAALLFTAAVLGDAVNYAVGRYFGTRVAARFVRPAHLERTRQFYERHGGKTVVIARFIPIVRTFAPFVAGMGAMAYRRFFFYNVAGGLAWVLLFTYTGYFFGNIPAVEERFSLVVLAIIAVSVLPVLWEFARHRLKRGEVAASAGAEAREAAQTVARVEAEEERGEARP